MPNGRNYIGGLGPLTILRDIARQAREPMGWAPTSMGSLYGKRMPLSQIAQFELAKQQGKRQTESALNLAKMQAEAQTRTGRFGKPMSENPIEMLSYLMNAGRTEERLLPYMLGAGVGPEYMMQGPGQKMGLQMIAKSELSPEEKMIHGLNLLMGGRLDLTKLYPKAEPAMTRKGHTTEARAIANLLVGQAQFPYRGMLGQTKFATKKEREKYQKRLTDIWKAYQKDITEAELGTFPNLMKALPQKTMSIEDPLGLLD